MNVKKIFLALVRSKTNIVLFIVFIALSLTGLIVGEHHGTFLLLASFLIIPYIGYNSLTILIKQKII